MSTHRKQFQRFEHEAPNHLWQMDFKGNFAYAEGRCHPLTILDDHSRFSVLLKACEHETRTVVKALLIEAFRRYGLPERINVEFFYAHVWVHGGPRKLKSEASPA